MASPKPAKLPKFPFAVRDKNSLVKRPMIAVCAASLGSIIAVYHSLPYNRLTYCTIPADCAPGASLAAYALDTETDVKATLASLRKLALTHGAEPLAAQFLGAVVAPFTAKEEKLIMAAKKAADKPVGKGGKLNKKGNNAENLKKAREAKDAGPDTRKVKILNKENPYREGSKRADAFDAMLKAKTVEDYEKAGGPRKYLTRWVNEKRIELN